MIRNKKGVSEMVGYVLLIVIAVSVSVMVYAYLRAYVWVDTETCDEGVGLVVEDYNCNIIAHTLNLTIKNQGRHSVDGFIIHGNNESTRWFPIDLIRESTNGKVYFEGDRLNSSNSRSFVFDYAEHKSVNRIEIEPLQAKKNLIVCENAIITQDLIGCD
ncbi:MAG: hypothetical protein ABH840_00255 [Nanoarchaeota archaeon]